MSKLMLKIIFLFTLLIVAGLVVLVVESASTDDPITVDIGTLPAGKGVEIIFEVTVDEPFPVGVLAVCNQGTVSGDNFTDVLTDDPNEPGSDDQTCTTLDNVGQIVIAKDADPEDDAEFNFDGGSLGNFTLKDPSDDTETFADQTPGTYVFTETVPADWDLNDITCLTNDQTDTTVTDTVNSKVTIDLDAHETITCTFSNIERGRVLVDKVTDPGDDSTSFDFTLTGGPSSLNQSFSLTNAAVPHDSGPVLPGSGYTVSETVPSDWGLTTSCSNGSPVGNIDLGPGEIVTCTFTNTFQIGTIVVEKTTDPSPDPTDTTFSFTAGGGLSPTSFSLKNGQSRTFDDIPVGSGYSVTETVPSDWNLTNAICTDGSPLDNINLGPGETITCTFTNELRLDFGDAPDPDYPTLLASTGASHVLGSSVYLGDCVDGEADGQPSTSADGDDTAASSPVFGTCVGNDDEDGVTFMSCLCIDQTAKVDVVAHAACTLSAWVDFNADGDWADGGEELFPGGQVLAAGTNSPSFAVPTEAVAGTTYARFRCTTDGPVAFTGQASDGEVEDYQVKVKIPAPCPSDLDGNCWVNTADLSTLVSQWGECAGCAADLNGNGWVNTSDLSIFVSQWGECP